MSLTDQKIKKELLKLAFKQLRKKKMAKMRRLKSEQLENLRIKEEIIF
jgi:hypothetical protein